MKTQILLISWICVFVLSAKAQSILYPVQGVASVLDSTSVITLTYENDFANGTDQYYTQGISATYGYRAQRVKYGRFRRNSIELTHIAYTPQEITDSTIRIGDRPYAAALYAKAGTALITRNNLSQLLFNFYLGVLGPAAGGAWMQRTIHEAIGDIQPEGWKYQIRNALIVGPEIVLNKRLITYRNYFSADGMAVAKLTTLRTGATLGLTARAGWMPNKTNSKRLNGWIEYSALGNTIAYDATLQGALFGANSPYTISDGHLSRFVFYQNVGFHFRINRVELTVYTNCLSEEFNTGLNHSYSGACISYRF